MSRKRILLCVDNSTESNAAVEQSAIHGRILEAEIVVAHVYAAALHDQRFKDMEPNLPDEYRTQEKIESSRRMHTGLIGKGLEMISQSYIKAAQERLNGLPIECKAIEGTNYYELARESDRDYDLTIIGARGIGLASTRGETHAGMLGGVAERVMRRVRTDILLVRDDRPPAGTVLVAIDGSVQSFSALRRTINIARDSNAKIEVVTAFDPDYHPMAFKNIAGVLSEKHGKMFRFESQEQLHTQVIDRGLENLYEGYLENAKAVALGKGYPITTRLLTGRPSCEVAKRCRELGASLVVVSRLGRHKTEGLDIGHTAESIVRLAPCNTLVVHESYEEHNLQWTSEAEERLAAVPLFLRPMILIAVEAHARARELTTVTADVVHSAKTSHGVPMPGHQPDDGTGS